MYHSTIEMAFFFQLQIKRYGFVEPNEAEREILGLDNEHYGLDVRSDVGAESSEDEDLDKRYTQNHEYDEHGVQKKPYGYNSRNDETWEDQNNRAEPEIVQEPPKQQSGIDAPTLI